MIIRPIQKKAFWTLVYSSHRRIFSIQHPNHLFHDPLTNDPHLSVQIKYQLATRLHSQAYICHPKMASAGFTICLASMASGMVDMNAHIMSMHRPRYTQERDNSPSGQHHITRQTSQNT